MVTAVQRNNVSVELMLVNGQILWERKKQDGGGKHVNRTWGGGTYTIISFNYFVLFRHQGSFYFVTSSYKNSTDIQPQKSTVEMANRLTLQSCK